MHFKSRLIEGRLIRRYKRFLADVTLLELESEENPIVTVHCPNTGSMLNCQPEGASVWCSLSENLKRKYPMTWELIALSRSNLSEFDLVCVNTLRANELVYEALSSGLLKAFSNYANIKKEVPYGVSSRVDFLLQQDNQPDCYLEVKSVTLSQEVGVGLFPDAVTARGVRHLDELINQVKIGCRAVLLFCVQHSGVSCVKVADHIDLLYGQKLRTAHRSGVEILAYRTIISVSKNSMHLAERLPVILDNQEI